MYQLGPFLPEMLVAGFLVTTMDEPLREGY